jgi:polysaccharide export outer membrane protein
MQDTTSLIEPGDQLATDFYLSPELNTKVTVGPDGNMALPVAGVVRAAGLIPGHLAALLNQAYLRELRNPNVTVHILGTPGRQIYVGGEVAHPGAFPPLPGMTALQAISTAGGLGE